MERRQRLFPVMDHQKRMVGVLARSQVIVGEESGSRRVREVMSERLIRADADGMLHDVADRTEVYGVGAISVVDRGAFALLESPVIQFDPSKAREELLVEERHVERVLKLKNNLIRRCHYGASPKM